MLHSFIAHVQQQHLFPTGQQVLLAVSGGIDSVVLAHLMHSAAYPFAIAHCNFHLRLGDCDRDEQFVRHLAATYGVSIHVAQFQTLDHAARHHLCVEDAARQLRYDFFQQLCQQYNYAAILTAHHRDDAAETFFLNLLRGTGLTGLHGILPVNGLVVRPLLPFGRDDIEAYARQHHLQHVEDVTNASLDYRRNQVRHQLMPLLQQLQPAADHTIQQTILNLQSTESLYQALLQPLVDSLVAALPGGGVQVLLPGNPAADPQLSAVATPQLRQQLYYELLKPYGFHADTVSRILDASQPGRTFHSRTHTAYLRHNALLVTPAMKPDSDELPPIVCQIAPYDPSSGFDPKYLPPDTAVFDADTLTLPVRLRHWQQGDRFQPLGMAHGTQLLSDYFTDHKLTPTEKRQQLLLVDANDVILWLVGRRTDHPHRITPNTRQLLTVKVGR
ncbi:MAG: tRNA lysidine(34) synthetase TilS [Bacteroidales bacterium]|nr:tRNA lysidine(34) synthetase TilS [Bacteroidales bacterium]